MAPTAELPHISVSVDTLSSGSRRIVDSDLEDYRLPRVSTIFTRETEKKRPSMDALAVCITIS